jgi:tetratricopeptide (TPR) repeat protein
MAWGQRAKRSITAMALQVIEDSYTGVFSPDGVTGTRFENDVMRGASDGYEVLTGIPLDNDAETILAIAEQVQLLRDVRKAGPSSYFAYRMGVLSSLVADVMIPYGFAWSPDEKTIQNRINEDVEKQLDSFKFNAIQVQRTYIRNPQEYFSQARSFYAGDKRIIQEDYLQGKGVNGFLLRGSAAYFERSVNAVADVWNTVLRPDGDSTQPSATKRTLAWYYVDEINYLLKVKKNLNQSEKSYSHFVELDAGLPAAYETIGDLYYAYNTKETTLRGVREWKNAYDMPGADRGTLSKKLATHFTKEGRVFLDSASKPGAKDTDLPNALNAFEQAFEFERTDNEISDLIEKTHVAINQRNERFKLTVDIIATGEKVQAEGEKARLGGDRDLAIKTFRKASAIFESVNSEFKEQEKTARESVRKIKKAINDTINDILDQASDAIAQGDKAKETRDYAGATTSYEKVKTIVSVVPEDENPQLAQQKKEIIELAERKKEDAKVEKINYERAQEDAKKAAEASKNKKPAAGGGGGQPAAPAAPAKPAQ